MIWHLLPTCSTCNIISSAGCGACTSCVLKWWGSTYSGEVENWRKEQKELNASHLDYHGLNSAEDELASLMSEEGHSFLIKLMNLTLFHARKIDMFTETVVKELKGSYDKYCSKNVYLLSESMISKPVCAPKAERLVKRLVSFNICLLDFDFGNKKQWAVNAEERSGRSAGCESILNQRSLKSLPSLLG